MRTLTLLRIPAIAAVTFSSIVSAQSRPASPSKSSSTNTSLPPTSITAPPPAAPVTPAQAPPRRAQISYINGDLAIAAYNSSLNQILREVSRLTGVRISGGVSEERVFGNYGPAPTSEVLRTLLDGTGSNILFVQATGDKPSELILTPRMGGPTPPNPHAVAFDDNSEDVPPPSNPPIRQPSESQSIPAPQNVIPQPITPPPADSNSGATSPSSPTPNSNQQQSPNGVKTPQQIYEELQRLRQQQQQQSNPQ
ncbi:MAG: hypothetical protein C5B58_07380 [Acidobacteria bacterium]|nr:MAG: hypothetical protein C5B58_07380 [Acidobacteriota bacterium]